MTAFGILGRRYGFTREELETIPEAVQVGMRDVATKAEAWEKTLPEIEVTQ